MSFDIGSRRVGDGRCFIIAEVGLAHGGDLAQAHAYIDAVAARGVDAVKFQCHLGDPVYQWRVRPGWHQDSDRQAYWKRTDFAEEQWHRLQHHATDSGLEFLCSPFSVEAVKLLDPLVPAWKVPSGKVNDIRLLDSMMSGKPMILSFGMSAYADRKARAVATAQHVPVAMLHCTSQYPTPPDRVDLREYQRLRKHWVPTGLSDHSGTIYAGLAGVALGCDVLEVHVCFSKEQGGFDTAASIDMGDLGRLVEGVRFIEKAKQPVDKDALAEELEPMRRVFMREGAHA